MRSAAIITLALWVASAVAACASGRKKTAEPVSVKTAQASHVPEPAADAAPPKDQGAGWQTTALAGSGPVAVKEGTAPLVYLVEAGGSFRVHDQTDRKDLARGAAPGRTVIRVDARSGVVFGSETLLAGPLPADHRYAIYLDASGPNFTRQGTFQPRPARKE